MEKLWKCLKKYPNEDILVINMADGLSGTYQSTVSAKESVDHSENIHVINSMTYVDHKDI